MRSFAANKPEHIRARMINSLKVDEAVHMGIVSDVKMVLRKVNQLKLNYEVIAERRDWKKQTVETLHAMFQGSNNFAPMLHTSSHIIRSINLRLS